MTLKGMVGNYPPGHSSRGAGSLGMGWVLPACLRGGLLPGTMGRKLPREVEGNLKDSVARLYELPYRYRQ